MNPFSQRFVDAFQRRLPDVARLIQEVPEKDCVELCLTAPSGHGELFVTTEGGEQVEVSFGPWYGEYKEQDYWLPEGTPQGEPFERVLTLLQDLLRDLVVIRVTTKQGKQASTEAFHWWWYSAFASHPGWIDADHYYMISWTGRGDLLPPQPIKPSQ
jgi:hypothetical protein